MPNWKKVIVSGSNAALNSLFISTSVTASVFSGSSFTGSLLGTASYATNANSASYALNAGNTISASFATNAGSASYALNAGNAQSSSFASTASTADNFTVRGTLTAQTIVVQVITSSTDFITGSTRFGTLASNTHVFTGSVSISGSLTVQGAISGSNITGSLLGTSSYAVNALSASYAVNSGNTISASFSTNAGSSSYAINSGNAQSASFATNAGSASYALNATNAQTASFFSGAVTSASYASASTSASFATNAQTASFFSGTVTSASYAATASFATNGNSSFLHTQSAAATTWSVVHNFQTQFPVVTVYDNTNSVIIPQQISASSTSSLTILFSTPRTGYVAVSKGGYTANVGTASFAFTSSLAVLALTASFFSGSISTAVSSSYAATSSYSEGFKISQAQYFATSSAISGSSRIIVLSTSSFNAVFVDYVLSSGSNQRAGTVVGTWNSSSVQFMDNSTLDIGTTSVVTMSVAISASSAVVQTQSPAGWTIKTTYRTI